MKNIKVDYKEMFDKSNNIEFLKNTFEEYKKGTYFFSSLVEEVSFLYNLGLFFSEYYEKNINLKQEDYIEYIFRNSSDYYYILLFTSNKDF